MGLTPQAEGLLLAALASLSWSVFAFFMQRTLRGAPVLKTAAVVTTVNAFFVTLIALAAVPPSAFRARTGSGYLFLFIAGALHIGISRYFYYTALQRIGPSRSLPVTSAYPAVTAVLAAAWLNEALTLRIGAGLLLLILGISFIVRSKPAAAERGGTPSRRTYGWIAAGITALLWALAAVFFKMGLRDITPLAGTTLALWAGAALLWIASLLQSARRPQVRIPRGNWLWLLAAAGCQAVSFPAYNAALTRTLAVHVTSIIAMQPLAALLIGWLFLRAAERLTLRLAAGVLLAAGGTLLVVT